MSGMLGDEFIEHTATSRHGVGAPLGGIGLEIAIHAEILTRGTTQGQQENGEGIE
jgi:hypothetical protein